MTSKDQNTTNQAQEEALQWLALLNSPRLTAAQEKEFFSWLALSHINQAAYVKAEQLWQRGAVLAQVKDAQQRSVWSIPAWQGWAVACSVLVMVCWTFFSFFNPDGQHYRYQTVKGEQKEQLLIDGSHIVLNTDSLVDITFDKKLRRVELHQGEVFFDIKKEERPFDVVTQLGVVRVIGTHFSVYRTAADVQVTVVEGRVALGAKPTADEQFTPAAILHANQRLTLNRAVAGDVPETVDTRSVLAWRKKQLVFKGQALDIVVDELNRYLPKPVRLADPALGRMEITAVIQLNAPQSSLAALAQSLGLRLGIDGDPAVFTLSQ